jgi:hypothetical protein
VKVTRPAAVWAGPVLYFDAKQTLAVCKVGQISLAGRFDIYRELPAVYDAASRGWSVAPGGSSCRWVGSADCFAVRGEEFVEQ